MKVHSGRSAGPLLLRFRSLLLRRPRHLLLIGKSEVYAECWVHEPFRSLGLDDLTNTLHIRVVQLDDLQVFLNAAWSYRFGDYRVAQRYLPAQQYRAGFDVVLLGDFLHAFLLEKGAACTTKRRVGGNVDVFRLAEVDNLLLWEIRMVLDLIRCWNDFSVGEELFEELDAVVADSDGLDFACLQQLLHFLPCLDMRPVLVEVTRAVRKFRIFRVIAIGALTLSDGGGGKCCSETHFIGIGQCIRYKST